jgi:hypothetical protein
VSLSLGLVRAEEKKADNPEPRVDAGRCLSGR